MGPDAGLARLERATAPELTLELSDALLGRDALGTELLGLHVHLLQLRRQPIGPVPRLDPLPPEGHRQHHQQQAGPDQEPRPSPPHPPGAAGPRGHRGQHRSLAFHAGKPTPVTRPGEGFGRALPAAVLTLFLVASLTGCGRYYWSKPGATPEQFTRDDRECLRLASSTLPAGVVGEAVEQAYRACLNARGYVRDKQYEPVAPGFYRGVEGSEEFRAVGRAATAGAQPGFEQALAHLDDLKARGRITDDEYATMRRRLVESVTPGGLALPPPAPPPPASPPAPPLGLGGRWYGRDHSTLDIRTTDERTVEWEWELGGDRGVTRAAGSGTASGDRLSLIGHLKTGTGYASQGTFVFELTRDGAGLRGTSRGPNNLPVNAEFTRTPP
jgi:hypothetical protein